MDRRNTHFSFGDTWFAWFEEARCKLVDKEVGQLIGKVMWCTKIKDKQSSLPNAYDIAWEYSSLGESSIVHSYLVDACHGGGQILTLHTSAHTSDSQPVFQT
jgi:hypothetical protein